MRYISDLNISFSLLVDGVDKRFSFTPMAKGGSMYIAKTEAEIKASTEERRAKAQSCAESTGREGRRNVAGSH